MRKRKSEYPPKLLMRSCTSSRSSESRMPETMNDLPSKQFSAPVGRGLRPLLGGGGRLAYAPYHFGFPRGFSFCSAAGVSAFGSGLIGVVGALGLVCLGAVVSVLTAVFGAGSFLNSSLGFDGEGLKSSLGFLGVLALGLSMTIAFLLARLK